MASAARTAIWTVAPDGVAGEEERRRRREDWVAREEDQGPMLTGPTLLSLVSNEGSKSALIAFTDCYLPADGAPGNTLRKVQVNRF